MFAQNLQDMFSICSSARLLLPPWRRKNARLLVLLRSRRRPSLIIRASSSSSSSESDDSAPKPRRSQVGYDPAEELLGLDVDLPSRNAISGAPRPRSWFGPNGQYMRELPCPSCRGRGYTPCTDCGIERSRLDCLLCSGKGIVTCHRCLGECVVWEESIDEQPWENARSMWINSGTLRDSANLMDKQAEAQCPSLGIQLHKWGSLCDETPCGWLFASCSHWCSPFKVEEDDEVDNLDIKLDVRKKSKRVYQSTSPEVGLKISRALKSLNEKTGLFSNRMKIIHRDPMLHAQRVAAIKKAKGTPAARKHASELQKAFFSDPENRHKRSMAMKGIKFYCSYCGREGHRRHYCPELRDSLIDRRFRCRLCGEKGHNRRTCEEPGWRYPRSPAAKFPHCRICGQSGHNRGTCPERVGAIRVSNDMKSKLISARKTYTCSLCQCKGHNIRSCPSRESDKSAIKLQSDRANK